jgi:hypothetical protein
MDTFLKVISRPLFVFRYLQIIQADGYQNHPTLDVPQRFGNPLFLKILRVPPMVLKRSGLSLWRKDPEYRLIKSINGLFAKKQGNRFTFGGQGYRLSLATRRYIGQCRISIVAEGNEEKRQKSLSGVFSSVKSYFAGLLSVEQLPSSNDFSMLLSSLSSMNHGTGQSSVRTGLQVERTSANIISILSSDIRL